MMHDDGDVDITVPRDEKRIKRSGMKVSSETKLLFVRITVHHVAYIERL